MVQFLKDDTSEESQFRAVFLFGRNVATYKFALAKSLLQLSKKNNGFISLEDLSPIYVQHMLEHVRSGKRQITSSSSKFIHACQLYDSDQITWEQLLTITEKLGFNNVLDAFHNIPTGNLETSFFEKVVQGNKLGIVLTDDLFKLGESIEHDNMYEEIEGRWNLVETAWNERNTFLEVKFDIDLEELFNIRPVTAQGYMNSHNRISLTPVRKPLNGYQKGKCFYCFNSISIDSKKQNTCDIDHFIPLSIQYNSNSDLDLNGVWNLVLSCQDCNRGEVNGKFARLPHKDLLLRLHKRNEYLIDSNHPLKETLIMRTGSTSSSRWKFLDTIFGYATSFKNPEWSPREIYGISF
ncbi:HNH endonuclease domain-containing protein [Bacillus sp. AFS029533]|uniref:HNH endonuclease domain-containing protein n=1 Tax=Bacillus sp. AFS029533 TaxID=2033494 RepID=UPI000BFB1882|nr:HNH endonuclease domain-containing protein [Bacillus sp. AFS029533]PGZ92175.1 HNH endonuclease [Bacillus sp. AFS029533]